MDLLTLSRVETKGKAFKLTDLNQLMEQVLENLQETLKESKIRIHYPDLPSVFADRSQIRSLLQNLILNGIKYNKSDSPEIQIDFDTQSDMHIIYITDNGIGVDAKFHERIFLLFQRLHTEKEFSGTGIGLSLCKKIVERHGGRIGIESESGKGSTFYFTLPKKGMRS